MKKIAATLIFLAICALCRAEESTYYYESWRYEPLHYSMRPYSQDYGYSSLTTPPYYNSSNGFDPSKPYVGLSYGWTYGRYRNYHYPYYNSWWNGYSVYFNIFPNKYINPVDDKDAPHVPGSAPLILKENEPRSPMDLMLQDFLASTNRIEIKAGTLKVER
ncbi:MAG: hypothetical protein PF904_06790 [Kiritimatiellae bacterium]|nr:hypothetical protein [Kiritimatiellia bacterium]